MPTIVIHAPTNVYPWVRDTMGIPECVEVQECPHLVGNKMYMSQAGEPTQTATYVLGRTASEYPADFVYFTGTG